MITSKKKMMMAVMMSLPLVCSCVNNDYDLSDIDTTARIAVNNLTVPVNLDDITLDRIIETDSTSKLREVTDPVTGKKIYAVVTDGTFESSNINIPSFTAAKPVINPIRSSISLEKINSELDRQLAEQKQQLKAYYMQMGMTEQQAEQQVKANEAELKSKIWQEARSSQSATPLAEYAFSQQSTEFESRAGNVDKAIRTITKIKTSLDMTAHITINNLGDVIKDIKLTGLKIQLPRGLSATPSRGTYDKASGVLDLSQTIAMHNGSNELVTIHVSEIDPKAAGIILDTLVNGAGTFTFRNSVAVLSGNIKMTYDDFAEGKTFFDLPQSIDYTCQPEISAIDVKKVSGVINYAISGVNINPVVLNDIPEFLMGDKTDITLSNPQLYLNVNNPMHKYSAAAQTGLSIYGMKGDVKRQAYQLDNDNITIDGQNNYYCISPTKPEKYYGGFENARFEQFTGLRNILSGDGLPTSLCLDVVNPCIPHQHVEDLELGSVIDKVKGRYTFFAPLNLEEGSVIVYNKTQDGWDDESVRKLTIKGMRLSATATTDLPLDATVTLTAIDDKGRDLPAKFSEAHIDANASGQSFSFEMQSGMIQNLGGIRFTATVNGKDASKTLAPVSKIQFKNLKATVSGYYDDKL